MYSASEAGSAGGGAGPAGDGSVVPEEPQAVWPVQVLVELRDLLLLSTLAKLGMLLDSEALLYLCAIGVLHKTLTWLSAVNELLASTVSHTAHQHKQRQGGEGRDEPDDHVIFDNFIDNSLYEDTPLADTASAYHSSNSGSAGSVSAGGTGSRGDGAGGVAVLAGSKDIGKM